MKKTRTDQAGLRGTTRNLTGPKSSLAKAKLGAGDIVVISAPDMSRSIAQRLLDAKVGAVINTDQFTTGRMPNFGPQMLLDSGIELVENAGSDVAAKAKTGKKGVLDQGKLFYGDRVVGQGDVLTEAISMGRFEDSRETLGDHMEALAGNTAEFVRTESPLLIDGLGIPDVDVDMDDRKVLIVSPDAELKEKLKELRYFLREYDPVIIGVEDASDTLIAGGHRPDLIIGDPEHISNESLRCGATVILPAEPDGYARGLERIQDLGVGAMTFPAATKNPTDLALLLADYHGASMVVNMGQTITLDRVFQEAHNAETPSALLSRLRVGSKLVDSSAVAELYRVSKSGGGWLWAVLGILVALTAIMLIAGLSGDGNFVDNLIDSWNSLALHIQSIFKN